MDSRKLSRKKGKTTTSKAVIKAEPTPRAAITQAPRGTYRLKDIKFKDFAKLPVEIRLMVWKFHRGHGRIVKITHAENTTYDEVRAPGLRYGNPQAICASPTPAPAQLSACSESRQEALKYYTTIFPPFTIRPFYFKAATDILFIPNVGVLQALVASKDFDEWRTLGIRNIALDQNTKHYRDAVATVVPSATYQQIMKLDVDQWLANYWVFQMVKACGKSLEAVVLLYARSNVGASQVLKVTKSLNEEKSSQENPVFQLAAGYLGHPAYDFDNDWNVPEIGYAQVNGGGFNLNCKVDLLRKVEEELKKLEVAKKTRESVEKGTR